MNATNRQEQDRRWDDRSITDACRLIAPAWPLDEQIAVNPLWGLTDTPFDEAAASFRRIGGRSFLPSVEMLERFWRDGAITSADLAIALTDLKDDDRSAASPHALSAANKSTAGRPLPSDILDRLETPSAGPRWSELITQQISQFCASYFDRHQADWQRPDSIGLYADWRAALAAEHSLELLKHAPQIRERAQKLPTDARKALDWAVSALDVSPKDTSDFYAVCLLRINGWASWCAYLAWQAQLRGGSDDHLHQLLAIRCCWEALLMTPTALADNGRSAWQSDWQMSVTQSASTTSRTLELWQRALEVNYQRRLLAALSSEPGPESSQTVGERPRAQLVFCIDVRSERFRRAIESVYPAAETLGFAGFFGLPVAHRPLGDDHEVPQLPGLLAPRIIATDTTGSISSDHELIARRQAKKTLAGALTPYRHSASGAFALVETVGLGYAGALLRNHLQRNGVAAPSFRQSSGSAPRLRPMLLLDASDGVRQKTELAAGILRAMGLTHNFARLVALVGHRSESANNPQAAALDCGACGGHSGELNARLLAGLLNDQEVREGLAEHAIDVPVDTVFVPAVHNTTTDVIDLLDDDLVPTSHTRDLQALSAGLGRAGEIVRTERAQGLDGEAPQRDGTGLLQRLLRRAGDWSETRPEWGLADNAAFIVAPRTRTRGLDLDGRTFLHEYRPEADTDGSILELIMTAPMVVAHWINMQYYASTVVPELFGSGNKVLHNVVGGRIGVFEGNTGDLRIGLSYQSIHDGKRYRHTPLRLNVVIDAPRERIDAILAKHAKVRDLVEHRWLYLFRYTPVGMEQRTTHWTAAGLDQPYENGAGVG